MDYTEFANTMIIAADCKLSPYYCKTKRKKTVGLFLHSVGCAQPLATVFLKKWNQPTYKRAFINAFIDAHSGKVYRTMPWAYRAPHAGNSTTSSTYIGVEMCESSYIKYGTSAKFEVLDLEAAQKDCKVAYDSAVLLFAYLCKEFDLDPLTDIISHYEGGKKGIASHHVDPEHYWTGLQMPYTMDGFRADVKAAMNYSVKETATVNVPTTTTKSEGETFTMEVKLSTVKKGVTGKYVKMVQILLNGYGYDCGTVDGDCGNKTVAAIKKFQAANNLTADGSCGPKTWAVLLSQG